MFNLAVIVRESAHARPDRPALLWDGGSMSYAELDVRSDEVAEGLVAAGVAPGDPVALQLPNVPEFPVAYFGILKAGATVVPLNVLLKADEVGYHLTDCAARVFITWAGVLDEAARGAARAGVDAVFVVGAADRVHTFPALGDLCVSVTGPRPLTPREPTDTAAIVYTAGTTGRPKGAELTHFQLYMNSDLPGRLFAVDHTDVVITVLPLFHIFAMSAILDLGIRHGCALVLIPRFVPAAVLAAIERYRATVFDGVPTMYLSLLAEPDLGRYDLSSLRLAISGGASLPAHVLDEVERRIGVAVYEGYGLSETAATATQNHGVEDRRPYSVGKPAWGVEVQVWDAENRPLSPGRDNVGEVVIRGFNTMKGYHNRPEATAEAFAGGWFHTGDLGYRDEDGFLFIVDRKKDLIIRGGYNVYPREVEEVLHAHPAVAQAAVVRVPDERLGEEVKAFVRLKPGQSATAADIVEFCRERLAAYKYPRLVEFCETLPMNSAGKVLKSELAPVPVG